MYNGVTRTHTRPCHCEERSDVAITGAGMRYNVDLRGRSLVVKL